MDSFRQTSHKNGNWTNQPPGQHPSSSFPYRQNNGGQNFYNHGERADNRSIGTGPPRNFQTTSFGNYYPPRGGRNFQFDDARNDSNPPFNSFSPFEGRDPPSLMSMDFGNPVGGYGPRPYMEPRRYRRDDRPYNRNNFSRPPRPRPPKDVRDRIRRREERERQRKREERKEPFLQVDKQIKNILKYHHNPEDDRLDLRKYRIKSMAEKKTRYGEMRLSGKKMFLERCVCLTYMGREEMFTEKEVTQFIEFAKSLAKGLDYAIGEFKVVSKWSFTPFLQINCKTNETYSWLLKNLQGAELWDKKLKLVRTGNSDELQNATMKFPPEVNDVETGFKYLMRQNPTLAVQNWIVVDSFKDEDGGFRIALNIDKESSLKTLKEMEYRPFLLMGRVDVYIRNASLEEQLSLDVSKASRV